MTASASAFIARWISFGRKTKSGRNNTAAPMNASVISARPARKIPSGILRCQIYLVFSQLFYRLDPKK
jgi:hypothetical protein